LKINEFFSFISHSSSAKQKVCLIVRIILYFLYLYSNTYMKRETKDPAISRVPQPLIIRCVMFVTGMIMGAAVSTVYYNLKLRHPTLNMPIIDYDLALLIQPMLMLGISIGVAFNVVFPDWIVTILLIVLFLGDNHSNCHFTLALIFVTSLNDFTVLQAPQQKHSVRGLKPGKRKP